MIIKANWDIFKAKFSENPQDNFEWFCYLLFSKEYNQPYGTHRYKNQSGIETDPIEVENEVIGWQSKFYEDSLSNHKDDLLGTLVKSKRDYPNITKIILYTNSEWGQGQGGNDPKAKSETEKKANDLGIKLEWRVKSYFESPFVCIDNDNISKYFFMQESFVSSFEWISEKTKINIRGVGKRYAPNDIKYESLNQTISISNIFNFIDNDAVMKYINNIGKELLQNRAFISKNDILKYIETLKTEIPKARNKLVKNIQYLESNIEVTMDDPSYIQELDVDDINIEYGKINKFQKIINNQEILLKKLSSKNLQFYEKNILLISGEALIGKTHLFCDIALDRLENNQQTLLFFGNNFDGSKSIVKNMIEQLGLTHINEDEFLEALDLWANKYGNSTLIMIDAINETENSKIWQEGIIKFCEQIKSYQNLALAMSVRDVEKNKIITPTNEEYIANEIVEVEHRGFEGIELEAVRTFCEALKVEFPKVPIHTYRLFVNPGMLFLYIETIKNSTKKIDTSIINPLTIFKSYEDDLERKYYQKYPNEIDEEDEVISEAIEEFISLGTQKDYLHFYLDYKEVKKKLKPLHTKILEFLISEGVLNKLKQESGTKVYFTYQKFENFFIADYLLDDFDRNREKIFKLIKEYHGAISEALFMQIPEKLSQDIFDLNIWFIRDKYICRTYLESLVWRNPDTINDMTFKYINFILHYHNLSSIFLDTTLQLSSIPNHPLNILRLHKVLLRFNLSERDYEWSIYLHDSYEDDKIVKRIINWAWDKKEEFEIEDESLYLYGLTLGWFLTSSNRELRDGATKALVNLFTDRVDVFLNVLKEFETVDDLYVLERLYSVAYGIVLRSNKQNRFKELGKYIYQTIFNVEFVIENIMLRDYAKLTIEYIENLNTLNLDILKIQPPYNQKSNWKLEKIEEYEVEIFLEDYPMIYGSSLHGDFKIYTLYPNLNIWLHRFNGNNIFNIKDAKRWLFKELTTYGWTKELFYDFDYSIGTGRSHNVRNERIGKKYQWLAMYKLLAKISDNYKYDKQQEWYKGTYELRVRNIDPTSILKEKHDLDNKWWFSSINEFQNYELSDKSWMGSKEKLPKISEYIFLEKIHKKYLLLDISFSITGNKEKKTYRELYYHINSFIVKKDNLNRLTDWIKKQNFYARKMPESSHFSNIFLREYPHSITYQSIDTEYYGQVDWSKSFEYEEIIPTEVLLTSTSYFNEAVDYDYSISRDSSIEIMLPNKWFINKMELYQSVKDATWVNKKDEIVFFDPTIDYGSSSKPYDNGVLLADKNILFEFLEENNYTVFWILWGEKQVHMTQDSNMEDFLGISEISGYGYFDGNEFVEHIDINWDEKK